MKTKKPTHSRFFALLSKIGVPRTDRRDFIFDYTHGLTDSLTELFFYRPHLYNEMLDDMEKLAKKADAEAEADKWRKRVFAAIGGYLKLIGSESNANIIKAIACRATGYSNFNNIPKERLRNAYSTFLNKQKDFKALDSEMQREIATRTMLN